jgi:hypothetical protein
VIWILTGCVNTLSIPLKNEGEHDLLVNGKNQTYSCVLGWAGNLKIHQMVILSGPDEGTVEWGNETWGSRVACDIRAFIVVGC